MKSTLTFLFILIWFASSGQQANKLKITHLTNENFKAEVENGFLKEYNAYYKTQEPSALYYDNSFDWVTSILDKEIEKYNSKKTSTTLSLITYKVLTEASGKNITWYLEVFKDNVKIGDVFFLYGSMNKDNCTTIKLFASKKDFRNILKEI